MFHIRGPPSAPAGRLEPPRRAAAALAHSDPMGKGPLPTTDTLTLSPPASAAAPRAILRKGSLLQSSGGRQRRVAPVARAAPSAMAWRSAKVRRAAREAAAALATAAAGAPCPASRSVAARRGSFLTLSARFFSLAYEGRARALSKWEGRQVCACREVAGRRGAWRARSRRRREEMQPRA